MEVPLEVVAEWVLAVVFLLAKTQLQRSKIAHSLLAPQKEEMEMVLVDLY